MERIVFSISTSFYNREKWVEVAYEQLCEQTYPFWEWVVTDDFSVRDSSEEKLKELSKKDPRVKYYKQSRKKELFYNPNYGCSGNVVVQLDCDDLIYPRLLETYAHYFSKDPDLMGVLCGYVVKENLGMVVHTSTWEEMGTNPTYNHVPMGRAWRNVIPHFDLNGELNWYQNDTNIWRHVEARGKTLFIPREFYVYNRNLEDSISKFGYTDEQWDDIEQERLKIEGKFPHLLEQEECTYDLRYLPINEVSWAFYQADFNLAKDRKDVLFIKANIKTFEKQLLNELFYDHSLYYDVEKREKYDEIIAFLDEDTYEWMKENFNTLRQKHRGTGFRFFINRNKFSLEEKDLLIFGLWSYNHSNGMYYGYVSL